MTEIKLTKRYPQSRTEDIVDAYMRGWNDALDAVQNGKFIINDDRKTENCSEKPNNSTISKMEQVDKDINVRSKDEPQTERIKTPDYCDICNHKGCGNCTANNLDDYCVPSGYEPITQMKTQNSNSSFEKADEPNKIIEAYSQGFKDGAEAVKAMLQTFVADGIVFAKMDEPQTCSVNGRPYDCGNCEYHKCTADEPQTECPQANICRKPCKECGACEEECGMWKALNELQTERSE